MEFILCASLPLKEQGVEVCFITSVSGACGICCREIGIRFHPTRGAMSLGESKGGLPPDSCTEDESVCLADMKRLIEEFHDNSRCCSTTVHPSNPRCP